jgi:restriction system protein
MALVKQQRRARSLPTRVRAAAALALGSMSWRHFERMIGEAFRRRGFTVTGFGGNAHDGGVDLGLMKNGERFLVQCKHWQKPQVAVTAVRDLDGVIAAQRAHGGFLITGGEFTREARELAGSSKIELIDGASLGTFMGEGAGSQPRRA